MGSLIALLLVLVVLSALAMVTVPPAVARFYAQQAGTPVQATVRWMDNHFDFNTPVYQIRYEYELAGQLHFQTDAISGFQYDQMRVGRLIPGKAVHMFGQDFCFTGIGIPGKTQRQGIFIGLGCLFLVIMLILALMARMRIRRILRTGSAVGGKVIHKKSVGGRSPSHVVTFRFTTRAGISYTAKNSVSRDGFYRVGLDYDITVIYNERRPEQCVAYECSGYEVG